MIGSQVFVIIQKFIYRKESDAWVKGAYTTMFDALIARDKLFNFELETARENEGDGWIIESESNINGPTWRQYHNHEEYNIFEIVMVILK